MRTFSSALRGAPVRLAAPALACAALIATPCVAQAVPQTWVSGVGEDVNPCSRTAPCKTLAGAYARTDTGGIITVLDPGGFGALTITKAITVDATGSLGGVLVSGTNGIVVNAPGASVTLRGLAIETVPPCTPAGASLSGVLLQAGQLHIEETTIRGFPGSGVSVQSLSAGTSLVLDRSDVRDNCTGGVSATSSSGETPVTLSNNFLSDDGTAVSAGTGSRVLLNGNTIADNATALAATGGALTSLDNNHLAGNTANGVTPLELQPPLAPLLPAPTVTPSTGTTKAPVPTCVVPSLRSKTLKDARKALARAHCVLGVATYRKTRHGHRGRIYAQQPKSGTLQYAGAIVNVTLDGHPARRHAKKPRARQALGSGATRTWVSGVGSDANPCSRTAPCLTFNGALAKTASGGTVDALDPGNLGPITLNAASSNTGTVVIQGSQAGTTIEVPAGSTGVIVDSGAGANVTLRDITIISNPGCSGSGTGTGIDVLSGSNLHLENVQVSGFADSALKVEPGNSMSVTLRNSVLYDNCTNGIAVHPSAGSTDLTSDGSQILNNPTGISAGTGATVRLANTTIAGSSTALSATGGGVIAGWPGNDIGDNASAGSPLALLEFI